MHDHKPLNKDKSLVVDFERSFTGVNRIYKVRRWKSFTIWWLSEEKEKWYSMKFKLNIKF